MPRACPLHRYASRYNPCGRVASNVNDHGASTGFRYLNCLVAEPPGYRETSISLSWFLKPVKRNRHGRPAYCDLHIGIASRLSVLPKATVIH